MYGKNNKIKYELYLIIYLVKYNLPNDATYK